VQTEEDKKNFQGYLAHNKKVIASLGTSTPTGEYLMNGPDKKSMSPFAFQFLSDRMHYEHDRPRL